MNYVPFENCTSGNGTSGECTSRGPPVCTIHCVMYMFYRVTSLEQLSLAEFSGE